jgi:acetolactate synthase-1/2/3 large subunit
MPTGADAVAGVLAETGIEYIFGVPGSLGSVELIEAASKRGIRYVLCSNESSAAVMAGTYGVLRNRPGVCSTGVGPGAVAAVHGVAHCSLERAPCLVLTDRYSDSEFGRLRRQRLDQDMLFRPLVKQTFKLEVDSVASTMRQAVELSVSGRPGPVHVDMPYDVMLAEVTIPAVDQLQEHRRYIARAGLDHPGILAAAERIQKAAKPVVIVGLQVNRSGEAAEQGVVALAERLGAPVFASLAAKGVLPEQHALSAGTFRGASVERHLLDQADLLVVVGFDVVELFAPGTWEYAQDVVLLDEVPHLEGVIRPEVEVVASLADSLRLLAEIVPASQWDADVLTEFRLLRGRGLRSDGDGLMPGAVVRIARQRLADNGIMTVDAGSHKVLACDVWESRRPKGMLTSSGLGTMAVALPAAMTAKLLEPQTPVLCLTGDGGFLMRLGDLEVAAREGLPIVVVVFNDRYLNLIKLRQDERGFQRLGTRYGEADFVSVARGLGFQSVRVETERDLDSALAEAFASGQPWVIDAAINPDGYSVTSGP